MRSLPASPTGLAALAEGVATIHDALVGLASAEADPQLLNDAEALADDLDALAALAEDAADGELLDVIADLSVQLEDATAALHLRAVTRHGAQVAHSRLRAPGVTVGGGEVITASDHARRVLRAHGCQPPICSHPVGSLPLPRLMTRGARPRGAGRPRARRSRAARTASCDPGGDGPGEPCRRTRRHGRRS